jgi:uncharacterized NAD-dependent epimerase/dehydratase family protein
MQDDIRGKALVLTNGMLSSDMAKTAHGLIRESARFELVGLVDHAHAGQDAGELLDGRHRGLPIAASVSDFFDRYPDRRPDYCVVGVALPGGRLPDDFRGELKTALERGCHLVNGLHTFLSEDAEFVALAQQYDRQLIDVRKPRPRSQLHFWSGTIASVRAPRIAVLGTDCAVGKRTTAIWLRNACRAAGIRTEMIYTGQTGWMQGAPYGFVFDSVVNDFVSGEVEHAIVTCDREARPDLILIEGQSSLRNPTGPCGSEFLLSGQCHGVILQHAPGRQHYEGTGIRISSLASEIGLIQYYGARVLAVTLNEEGLDDAAMAKVQTELETDLGLPVLRPLREGVDRLVPVVQAFLSSAP